MSFLPWRGRLSEMARVRRIVEVLFRNGLGFMVQQLALDRFLPRWWRRQNIQADEGIGLDVRAPRPTAQPRRQVQRERDRQPSATHQQRQVDRGMTMPQGS